MAGRVLRMLEGWPAGGSVGMMGGYGSKLTIGMVRSLAASCLSQDEVRAEGKKRGRQGA